MNNSALLAAGAAALWLFSLWVDRRGARVQAIEQFEQLSQNEPCFAAPERLAAGAAERIQLDKMSDRLGQAGFLTKRERARAAAALLVIPLTGAVCGFALGCRYGSAQALFGAAGGVYCGALASFGTVRFCAREQQRRVLYGTPLFLESLILLVESGLGILPSLKEIVSQRGSSNDPIRRVFQEVYELSAAGATFGEALRMVSEATPHRVLRHVLLHLDISGSEGGELVPALRSLGDHAHSEWKHSIETRVKRLENTSVFPVFVSVLGLLCLVAAVPLVPLFEVVGSLDAKQAALSTATGNGTN